MFLTWIAATAATLTGITAWRGRRQVPSGATLMSAGVPESGAGFAFRRGGRRRSASRSARQSSREPAGQERLTIPSVSVVVPALNEEESIDWVFDNIPAWVSEVVLVDGLSVDGTELVVTDRRDDVVIVHQRSRGKGAALRAGFAAASGEIIVMIDADGSTDPREMDRFVEALVEGAEFVKGSRNLKGGGSIDFTLLRHLGNLGFVWAANLLFRVRFTDLCYGYCAFWRRDLERLDLGADGFEIEMELILSAVKAGMRIEEVPSMELARRAGDSNLNAWKDGKRVLKMLLGERMRRPDPARADLARISLSPVNLAAHGTDHWMPAGSDRRRHVVADRRVSAAAPGSWRGEERRQSDRRSVPERTARILFALTGSDAPAANPAGGEEPTPSFDAEPAPSLAAEPAPSLAAEPRSDPSPIHSEGRTPTTRR